MWKKTTLTSTDINEEIANSMTSETIYVLKKK